MKQYEGIVKIKGESTSELKRDKPVLINVMYYTHRHTHTYTCTRNCKYGSNR